jgi:hypothetical protein
MTIRTSEYKGFLLSAYSTKTFPTHHDPYASGPKQFSSIVRIESLPPVQIKPQRYATFFTDTAPQSSSAAMDLAMQYGRNIIDGKVRGKKL